MLYTVVCSCEALLSCSSHDTCLLKPVQVSDLMHMIVPPLDCSWEGLHADVVIMCPEQTLHDMAEPSCTVQNECPASMYCIMEAVFPNAASLLSAWAMQSQGVTDGALVALAGMIQASGSLILCCQPSCHRRQRQARCSPLNWSFSSSA